MQTPIVRGSEAWKVLRKALNIGPDIQPTSFKLELDAGSALVTMEFHPTSEMLESLVKYRLVRADAVDKQT